ncbi:MAG: prohibitin family protein [Cytophagales bacterium]
MKKYILMIVLVTLCTSCYTIIRPGEVGLRRQLGKLKEKVLTPGLYPYNFFITTIVKVPIRTLNLILEEELPTKEGLNVKVEFSIIYHIRPEKAKEIVETIGLEFEDIVITSVLRSSAPNVTAKFLAKDLYTSERSNITKEIQESITNIIGDRGVVIEAVLLKSIKLPAGLSRSIELKLQSEQEAQQMDFVLLREKKEADRKIIEAEGIKKSQQIIAEGLSPMIIQYKSIDAFKMLSTSPNSKVIITNGKAPFLIGADQ